MGHRGQGPLKKCENKRVMTQFGEAALLPLPTMENPMCEATRVSLPRRRVFLIPNFAKFPKITNDCKIGKGLRFLLLDDAKVTAAPGGAANY